MVPMKLHVMSFVKEGKSVKFKEEKLSALPIVEMEFLLEYKRLVKKVVMMGTIFLGMDVPNVQLTLCFLAQEHLQNVIILVETLF